MGILPVLILVSLAMAGGGLALFFWALRAGQFDDLETPPHRVLWEEDEPPGTPSAPTGGDPPPSQDDPAPR